LFDCVKTGKLVTVPRDAVFYVRELRPRGLKPTLVELPSGRTVAMTTKRLPSWVVMLKPSKPLRPNTRYELRNYRKAIGRFTTTAKTSGTAKPELVGGRVEFSRVEYRRRRRKNIPVGRWGTVDLLRWKNTKPAVIEYKVTFGHGKRRVVSRAILAGVRFIRGRSTGISFAGIPGRCPDLLRVAAIAPARGRYTFTLTPWSAAGVRGKTYTLTGRIK
jgi:hypothetical protein